MQFFFIIEKMKTVIKHKTKITTTILSLGIVITLILPFFWMFLSTFKTNTEIFTYHQIFPNFFSTHFYKIFFNHPQNFLAHFWNSLEISILQTILTLILSISAGFVFANYSFKMKRILFLSFLTLIFIPKQIIALHLFEWMNTLNLIDTPLSVIFPGMLSGLGLLYFTQVFQKIPSSILDTLRIEGVSEFRIILHLFSFIKAPCIAYFFIHFTLSWNEYLIPLLMLHSNEKQTLALSIGKISGNLRDPYALMMIGGSLAIIPVFILYLTTQKYFTSALKNLKF